MLGSSIPSPHLQRLALLRQLSPLVARHALQVQLVLMGELLHLVLVVLGELLALLL